MEIKVNFKWKKRGTDKAPWMSAMERRTHYVLQILSLGTYQGDLEKEILWAMQDIDLIFQDKKREACLKQWLRNEIAKNTKCKINVTKVLKGVYHLYYC